MSPERICEYFAQNTPEIHFYSLFKLSLLGYEPKLTDSEYVAFNANELLLSGKRVELQTLALAVLAFANKHTTISTSLLSLQKTYSVF